jgi:Family of unknown function (DUF6491)
MAHPNKLISVAAVALLTLGALSASNEASARAAANESAKSSAADQTPAYEQVDSFVMWNHPYSWSPIDDQTVVLWPTPFEAYLVRITYPSHDMRYVQHIGVTQSTSRVYAKFDALQIRGFRYPIDSIYKLTREEARNLTSRKPEATQPKPPVVTEPKGEAENSASG